MLRSLTIKKIVLIEDLMIEFKPGLNVITGEAGAGKSVILDALELALGKRASGDYLRTGAEKATVEAVFAVERVPACLAEYGIEPEEGHLSFLRELYRQGRSLCRINGQAVPLFLCREAAGELIDFLIQGEQQALHHPIRHGEMLEAFSGLRGARAELERIYQQWRSAREKVEQLMRERRERARRADMLRYEISEIDAAAFKPEEVEELLRERAWLQNAARLTELANRGRSLLTGKEGSAVEAVGEAAAIAEEIARYRAELKSHAENLREAALYITEAARELERVADQEEYDPRRLDAIELRLDLFERLRRKYGDTVADILRYRDEAAAELETLERGEEEAVRLQMETDRLRQEWLARAERLQAAREEAALVLEEKITRELAALAMEKTGFKVVFHPVGDAPNPRGLKEAEFYFSANPGEPLKPLTRTASGGEAARTIFALKVIVSQNERVGTLFLDEVDTGVSGQALAGIAARLEFLSRSRQVICITHQPVVAAMGAVHLLIKKEVVDGRAVTRVLPLTGEARVKEVARLIGGASETATEHAKELIRSEDRA
ncbi:MAG TPA: DNA repair protein RecN [Desulfotomaculum sp.]|nr:DNA repair protein RecN [Desulfotomaculum sp.]